MQSINLHKPEVFLKCFASVKQPNKILNKIYLFNPDISYKNHIECIWIEKVNSLKKKLSTVKHEDVSVMLLADSGLGNKVHVEDTSANMS